MLPEKPEFKSKENGFLFKGRHTLRHKVDVLASIMIVVMIDITIHWLVWLTLWSCHQNVHRLRCKLYSMLRSDNSSVFKARDIRLKQAQPTPEFMFVSSTLLLLTHLQRLRTWNSLRLARQTISYKPSLKTSLHSLLWTISVIGLTWITVWRMVITRESERYYIFFSFGVIVLLVCI